MSPSRGPENECQSASDRRSPNPAPQLGVHLFNQRPDRPPVIGEIPIAILLGILIRNTLGLPGVYESGLRLCLRLVLRVGIALLGLRLSLLALAEIWRIGAPIVV